MFEFSHKQLEVIECIAKGMKQPQIANTLYNSPSTIGRHIQDIYDEIATYGYRRTMHQVAILYLQHPELFNIKVRQRLAGKTKRYFAVKMLQQRIDYKVVAERTGLFKTTVCTYKNQIPKKDFYTLPYLHKI